MIYGELKYMTIIAHILGSQETKLIVLRSLYHLRSGKGTNLY